MSAALARSHFPVFTMSETLRPSSRRVGTVVRPAVACTVAPSAAVRGPRTARPVRRRCPGASSARSRSNVRPACRPGARPGSQSRCARRTRRGPTTRRGRPSPDPCVRSRTPRRPAGGRSAAGAARPKRPPALRSACRGRPRLSCSWCFHPRKSRKRRHGRQPRERHPRDRGAPSPAPCGRAGGLRLRPDLPSVRERPPSGAASHAGFRSRSSDSTPRCVSRAPAVPADRHHGRPGNCRPRRGCGRSQSRSQICHDLPLQEEAG